MSQRLFDQGNWQAVIDAHPLESHDPREWLRYGSALLQTIEPGPNVGKQQQQAALAFVQALNEGATAEEVASVQRQSVLLSLREALARADISLGEHLWAGSTRAQPQTPTPGDPLQELTFALAQAFSLQLPEEAAVLDQLLVAKGQLLEQGVGAAAVEEALRQELPCEGQGWLDALQKVLLVLR